MSERTKEEREVFCSPETLSNMLEKLSQRTDQKCNDYKLYRVLQIFRPGLEKIAQAFKTFTPLASTVDALTSNVFGTVQTLIDVCLHSPISLPILGGLTSSVFYGHCRRRS